MRRLCIFLLVLAFALPALAQAKHPFTFEDMMKLKRVGEPEVSPDGKWVIFSVVDVDLEANTKTPHIWIVPTAGGQERETHSRSGRRPSALGAGWQALRLYVDERRRVAGLDRGFRRCRGNGYRTTQADFDCDRGRWRTLVAGWETTFFSLRMSIPNATEPPSEETACNAKKLKEAEQSKVKALIFTHLLYRHWNAYKEGKRTHLFVASVPDKLCDEHDAKLGRNPVP